MHILFASNNQGKISEFEAILAGTKFELVSTNSEGFAPLDVVESGETFAENALLKAKAYSEKYNLVSLADDSGLEVKALDNKPGVNSNRWFAGSDADRNQELLKLLKNHPDRSARFVTVACLYFPKTQNCHFFEGSVDGIIGDLEKGRGSAGFGYDPIFIPNGFEQTFAELGVEKKNQLSHRARAFAQVRDFLKNLKN